VLVVCRRIGLLEKAWGAQKGWRLLGDAASDKAIYKRNAQSWRR
jgi:hypothetical protein